MNLHDKRFFREEKPNSAWEYVAVPNKFRSGKIKASIDTGGYYVALVSVHPRQTGATGRPPQHDVLHFRGDSPQDLRERILKSFPTAVFTVANPEPDDLKAQFRADQKAAQERQAAIAAQKEFDARYNVSYSDIVQNLTPAEQDAAFDEAIHEFTTNPKFSNQEWVRKFQSLPNLMSYPDNRWANKATLKAFCAARGWIVPQAVQLSEAFNYLFTHGHFYMQPTYKRSEIDEKNAVRPFVREATLSETISENDIRETVRRLTAKFGMPLTVSVERLQAVGIQNAQAVFEKLQQLNSPKPIADKSTSTAEDKETLQMMRNIARGGARPRIENMKGY